MVDWKLNTMCNLPSSLKINGIQNKSIMFDILHENVRNESFVIVS